MLWSIGRKYASGNDSINVDFDVNGKTATSISGTTGVLTSNYGLNFGTSVGGTETTVPNGIYYKSGGTYISSSGKGSTLITNAGIRYTGPGDPTSVSANIGRIFDGYRAGGSNNQKINNQFNATYQDSDLTSSKFQTIVQARPESWVIKP